MSATGPKIVAVGEILWDLLPNGRQMGGAPTNFAYHAHALGASSYLISRVGDDALGQELVARLKEMQLPTEGVSVDPVKPTGTVPVDLAPGGQPQFVIREDVAWDYLEANPAAIQMAAAADAICFGSLAQRCEVSRAAIHAVVSAARPDALRVFDVNLRQNFYSRAVIEASLKVANVVKLNDAELPIVADFLGLPWSPDEQMTALAEQFSLRCVALTRGEHGSVLFAEGQWSEHSGIPTRVKDTVGAGDSFTAAMTLGLLAGWDLDEINHRANAVAAYVTSCEGATPILPEPVRHPFRPQMNTRSEGPTAAGRDSET